MGTISNATALFGLSATGTPTGTLSTGSITIGLAQTILPIPAANVAYALKALIADAGVLELDATYGNAGTSSTWTAGQPQIETATAAGTITLAGNASVTVTAAGMTGSPKTLSVAVELNDTAAQWAEKVRVALAADADVSALFTVGGTTTSITLTRKPTSALVTGYETYPTNDATLNIALADGTCTGITAAPTSTNTQAGVLTTGVKLWDADGLDFEGDAIPYTESLSGILIQSAAGSDDAILTDGTHTLRVDRGGLTMMLAAVGNTLTFGTAAVIEGTLPANGAALLTITVLGTAVP